MLKKYFTGENMWGIPEKWYFVDEKLPFVDTIYFYA
jgi:hypothetical protein